MTKCMNNRTALIRSLVVLVLVFINSCSNVQSEDDKRTTIDISEIQIEEGSRFLMALETSFFLDGCGDADAGQAYRKILRDYIKGCPSSSDQLEKLSKSMDNISIKNNEVINRYLKDNGSNPKFINNDLSCSTVLHDKRSETLRENIKKFNKGRISREDVIGINCKSGLRSWISHSVEVPERHHE